MKERPYVAVGVSAMVSLVVVVLSLTYTEASNRSLELESERRSIYGAFLAEMEGCIVVTADDVAPVVDEVQKLADTVPSVDPRALERSLVRHIDKAQDCNSPLTGLWSKTAMLAPGDVQNAASDALVATTALRTQRLSAELAQRLDAVSTEVLQNHQGVDTRAFERYLTKLRSGSDKAEAKFNRAKSAFIIYARDDAGPESSPWRLAVDVVVIQWPLLCALLAMMLLLLAVLRRLRPSSAES